MKNILVATIALPWVLAALLIFMLRPAYPESANALCLTEPEFTAFNTMTEAQIRDWLDGRLPKSPKGGFFKGRNPDDSNWTFTDLDNKPTDPAKEIFNAAQLNKINPRVLLTTLRKEKPRVFKAPPLRPSNKALQTLAGCGTSATAREQIQCMGQKLKEWFYDQLSQCSATVGGWNVDVEKETGDTDKNIFELNQDALHCRATPESKAVAALFQYTPWKGRLYDGCGWGHPDYPEGAGGNGLFCAFWRQHGWQAPPGPLALSTGTSTFTCPNGCIGYNASGGTPPYTWSSTKGVRTVTGVNSQNVKLTPLASNTSFTEVAYRKYAGYCAIPPEGSAFDGRLQQDYDCNGAPIGACFNQGQDFCSNNIETCADGQRIGFGCLNHWGASFGDQPCNPTVPIVKDCVGLTNEQCFSTPFDVCLTFAEKGIVCDKRTPAMIAAGCKPCAVEMKDGATVTVKDAAGDEVSTTVTVQ